MRLRCRIGIHVIDVTARSPVGESGACVCCGQRFFRGSLGRVNLSRQERRDRRRSLKVRALKARHAPVGPPPPKTPGSETFARVPIEPVTPDPGVRQS